MVTAARRYLRIAPRKVRLIIDTVRGLSVAKAETQLSFTPKRAADPIRKLLLSAVANAVTNEKLTKSNLFIKTIEANDGPTLKRFKPRAYGRAAPIRKRSTHLTITLAEIKKSKPATKDAKKPVAKLKTTAVKAPTIKKSANTNKTTKEKSNGK